MKEEIIDAFVLLHALQAIRFRQIYDIKQQGIKFVNKLIYDGSTLMIRGFANQYSSYRVIDYGITWKGITD